MYLDKSSLIIPENNIIVKYSPNYYNLQASSYIVYPDYDRKLFEAKLAAAKKYELTSKLRSYKLTEFTSYLDIIVPAITDMDKTRIVGYAINYFYVEVNIKPFWYGKVTIPNIKLLSHIL